MNKKGTNLPFLQGTGFRRVFKSNPFLIPLTPPGCLKFAPFGKK